MNTLKILVIVLTFGVIAIFGSEIGERISLPGAQKFGADGRSQSRTSADPGERCRGGAAHGAALRSGCILQPSRISVFGRPACQEKL